MRGVCLAVVACLVVSPGLLGAEGDAKKWLVGRWAPIPTPAKSVDASKPKPKPRAKASPKRPAAPAAKAEIPKCLLEFTKDGKVRLEGDIAPLVDTFGFLKPLKPLADFSTKFSPQNQAEKITYTFVADRKVEVAADHTWLLEKLSGGGTAPTPEKQAELLKEYQPRETLTVTATSRDLTLTNAQGKAVTFRRYTAAGSLEAAEGKRREDELRSGMSPFNDILRKQGINTGAPPSGKPATKKSS
jgi:hypothetical protein